MVRIDKIIMLMQYCSKLNSPEVLETLLEQLDCLFGGAFLCKGLNAVRR